MNNFISSFSLYEFIRILMPGAYLTLNISQFIKYVFVEYDKMTRDTDFNQIDATIIFAITSVIIGVFIYSIDNPRVLSHLFKSLPSNVIKNKLGTRDGITVLNSYFVFYDNLPDAVKYKTEKQSGFLHLSLNMVFVNVISLILLLVAMFIGKITAGLTLYFDAHFVMVTLLMIVSGFSAYLIYSKRLKYTYARSLELYFDSDEYKKLLDDLGKK
jgi:hypothetical protein